MKLLIGLGNPGIKYEHTRHNAGFLAVQAFAQKHKFGFSPSGKFFAEVWEDNISGQKVITALPQTFMNDSGKAVSGLIGYYKINPETDLIVVHDDTDLLFGKTKLVYDSSSAGHKGVQDIIEKLGTQKFHRLRIGVENRVSREDLPTETFVLQNFSDEEFQKLQNDILPTAISEIEKFIQ